MNRNTKFKAKQTEDSKLLQGLDSEASSTKTSCDKLTETLKQPAFEKEQDKQDMLQMKQEKEEMDESYKKLLYSNDTMMKEKDSVNKQLEGSIAMVQHIEVTENKLGRLNSEAEISASDINRQELLQKFLKLEPVNQELLGQLQSITGKKSNNAESLQGEICNCNQKVDTLENQINQICTILNEKEQLYSCSVERVETLEDKTFQVEASLSAPDCQLSEAKKQYDLTLEGKQIVSKHLKESSINNDQAIDEIRKKDKLEKTNAEKEKVARIQQDKEHNESTLQAYLKEELQRIQSMAENELNQRQSIFSKEHEVQIKSLRMKHEEECKRMQDELELQNLKVVVRSLHFPYNQFRMLSSNCSSTTDQRAPGNTALVILDSYNLPGAELFTTPAEGIFHLTFKKGQQEITLFIYGRDLYLIGWDGDKHGRFEIGKKKERCIPNSKAIEIEANYRVISNRALGNVAISPYAMEYAFDNLYNCDGTRYNNALDAVAIFAVNTSEATRFQEVFKEIQDSYELPLFTLDSRWDEHSGKDPLAVTIRSYRKLSAEYLKYMDCLFRKVEPPKIINRKGTNDKYIDDLRHCLRIPLRDAYNGGKFEHEARPTSRVW